MLLLLDHLGDTGLAVAALAAPHGGAGAVLDAGNRMDAQGVVNGLQDLGPGHGLAAADNLRNTNEFCPCRFWEQMV